MIIADLQTTERGYLGSFVLLLPTEMLSLKLMPIMDTTASATDHTDTDMAMDMDTDMDLDTDSDTTERGQLMRQQI